MASSSNLMIILGMMQVSKKIPFEDPQVLLGIRGLYIFSNVVIAVVYLVLQSRINSKKGKRIHYEPQIPMQSRKIRSMMKHISKPANKIPRNTPRPHNPKIRRTRTHGLCRRAQIDNNDCPLLWSATNARIMEVATDGRRHDVRHAFILQIHQPTTHPEYHSVEKRIWGELGEDSFIWPACRGGLEEAVEGCWWVHGYGRGGAKSG